MKVHKAAGLIAAGMMMLTAQAVAAETVSVTEDYALQPSCGGVYDLCGYRRLGDDVIVIPQTFEDTRPFSEGLAAVRVDGLYGYIDATGTMQIAPRFDQAGPFYDGIAEVLAGEHTTVIARSGEALAPAQFARSVPIGGEMLVVNTDTAKPTYSLMPNALYLLDASGLYNLRTGAVTPETYQFAHFEAGKSDLIWAREFRKDRPAQYGLMRKDGTWAVTPRYDHVEVLMDGMAVVNVETRDGSKRIKHWGAVDATGQLRVPLDHERLSYWKDGYGIAYRGGKQAFIDRDGRLLGGRFFDAVERVSERTVRNGSKWYIIADDGTLEPVTLGPPVLRPVAMPKSGPARSHCRGGVNFYTENGRWGLKGPDGQVLVPATFAAISCFESGVAWVPDEDKQAWCPIRPDGQRHGRLKCLPVYYQVFVTHHHPEPLDPNPFRSSVMWTQAYLRNAVDPEHNPPPRAIGDGVMGKGSLEISVHSD